MAGDPLWIDAITGTPAYGANEIRQAMALGLVYGGRLLGARPGVRPGGDQLKVSLAGSTITVKAGVMCLDPALTTPQGPYWCALPADETHTLTAADATNPRKDIIQGRVYDGVEDGSGLRTFRSDYKVGTPAASPAEPALDAGAVKLALIDVPQSGGGSAVVTDTRPWTVASGGVVPVRNQTERDALSAFDGLAVYRADRDWMEIHDGTSWRVQRIAVASSSSDLTTGVTHPYTGQLAYRSDVDALFRWSGSAWTQHPQGMVKRGMRITNSSDTSGSTELPVLRVDGAALKSGQLYMIETSTLFLDGSVADDVCRALVRLSTSGNATIASTQLQVAQAAVPNTAFPEAVNILVSYTPGSDQTVSVLLSIARMSGTGVVKLTGSSTAPIELFIRRAGADPGDDGVDL